MTIDKRMKYEMQGGSKPARNYLGAQKTVSGIPVKWKSGPDAPSTELAYITKAEKDLLLKKDLHGSLKNGPNTGPDNIMSLDSQGDYVQDRSPSRAEGTQAPGVGGGNSAYMDQQIQKAHDAKMKALLTGNLKKDDPLMHQTSRPGKLTRKYSDLPEWMTVDGKRKHIASAYKSYGTPSFFGNLFSRGAPGYRGLKGIGAFGNNPLKNIGRKGTITPQGNIVGGEYYSDYEGFGDTKDAVPFGIMGLLSKLFSKKKSRDFSEDNTKGLYEDFENRKIPGPGESAWKGGTFNPETLWPTGAIRPEYGVEYDVNTEPYQPPSASDDSWEWTDNPITDFLNKWQIPIKSGGEKFYDWTHNSDNPVTDFIKSKGEDYYNLTHPGNSDPWQLAKEMWPTYRGGLEDAGVKDWGAELQEDVSDKGWADTISERLMNIDTKIPFTGATIGDAFKGYKGIGEDIYNIGDKIREGINPTPELTAEEQLDMGLLPDPFKPFKDGGRVGYANGGLASLFTRRG